MRSKSSRFLITFFLGMFGVHKFIEGKIGMGVLYFCTCGIFGVGWLIDVLKIFFPYQRQASPYITDYRLDPKVMKNNIDNASLLEWQQLLIPGSDKLHLTSTQLQNQTEVRLETDTQIMHDCQNIIQNTTNIQIFFERYNLLIDKLSILPRLEKFMNLYDYGYEFTDDYDYLLTQYINDKQFYIKQLFDRCWNKAIIKADGLKTEKGKRNQFDRLMSEFATYKKQMTSNTVQYCSDKYFKRFEQYHSCFDTTDDYESIEIDNINVFSYSNDLEI